MPLKKPSQLFKSEVVEEELSSPVKKYLNETYQQFQGTLSNIENLQEKIDQIYTEYPKTFELLAEEVSNRVTKSDLDNVMYSQLEVVDRNFKEIQEKVKGVNRKDLREFKNNVSQLTEIVNNLIETELPQYKNRVTKTEVKLSDKFQSTENKVTDELNKFSTFLQERIDEFDINLEQTKEDVLNTNETFSKLKTIVKDEHLENKQKLEQFSETLNQFNSEANNFRDSLSDSLESDIEDFKKELKSLVSADFIVLEKHVKDDNDKLEEKINTYIEDNQKELVKLKDDVIDDVTDIFKGDIAENVKKLEDKIKNIQEQYDNIKPEEILQEGLLNIQSNEKNSDPLTPLDQNFVTTKQLQDHYRVFLNRVQEQLSTLGGGGETRLEFLDDVDRDTALINGKVLQYNAATKKWKGVSASGIGTEDSLVTSGIITAGNVTIGGITTALVVNGDGAITGVLTVGQNSVTLDGTSDVVQVGTALTLGHTQGIQFHTQNLHASGFEVNQINASGITTVNQLNVSGSGYESVIKTESPNLTIGDGTNTSALLTPTGSAQLNYNNQTKIQTTNTGASITGKIEATDAEFSGNVSVGGTLTYEDVTNIDSVGLITARDGIDCNGDLDVDGHTNLDNVSIAGVTTITSSADAALYVAGRSVFGNDTLLPSFGAGTKAVVADLAGNNNYVDLSILGGRSGRSIIKFGDHDDQDAGAIKYYHTDNSLNFTTNGSSTERLIINSTGNVKITNDLDVVGIATLGSGASGQADLHYQGVSKFKTQSWGAFAYGSLVATGDLKVNAYNNGGSLNIGQSNEFTINHDTTNTTITEHVGDININASTVAISTNMTVGGISTFTGKIIANNNVGINTNDPQAKLEVRAQGNTQGGIFITDSNDAHAAPYLRVLGKRRDNNTGQNFSGRVLLASLRTDGDDTSIGINTGRRIGTIMFGGNHTDGSESNILYPASIAGVANSHFSSASAMPTDLVFYTGSIGRTPTASNVSSGEERLRIASDGNISIGGNLDVDGHTELDDLNVSGITTHNEDVHFDGATSGRDVVWDHSADVMKWKDHAVAAFGDGSDFRIWHDGSRTNMFEGGTGNLQITGNGSVKLDIVQSTYSTDYIARFINNRVELHANATKRLETTGIGVSVYGDLDVDGTTNTGNLNVSGVTTFASTVNLGDNDRINFYDTNTAIYGNTIGLNIESAGSRDIKIQCNSAGGTAGDIILKSGSTEALTVKGTGEVGIGSAIPDYPLDVEGSIGFSGQTRGLSQSASSPTYSFDGDSDTGMYRGGGVNILSFATAGVERFSLDATGNFKFNAAHDNVINANGNITIDYQMNNSTKIRNFTKSSGFYFYPMSDTYPFVIGSGFGSDETKIYRTGEINVGTGITFSGSTGNITATGIVTTHNVTTGVNDSVGINTSNPTAYIHVHNPSVYGLYGLRLTNSATGVGYTHGFSLEVDNNQDARIINNGNKSIKFETNQAERARITSDGKVGIGSAIPQALLDVEGTGTLAKFGSSDSTYETLFIRNNTTGYPAIANDSSDDTIELRSAGSVQVAIDYNNNKTDKYFRVVANQQGSAGTELFRIQEDGKVGIGTNDPDSILHLYGGDDSDCVLSLESDGDNSGGENHTPYIRFATDGGLYNSAVGVNQHNVADQEDALVFSNSANANGGIIFRTDASNGWANADERLRITSDGKVGIGTTNPQALLDVNVGSSVTAFNIIGTEGQLFSVTNNLSSGSIFSVNDISGSPSIDVDADGTIQLAPLLATEKVGIGTTNPQSKLDVNGSVNVAGIVTSNMIHLTGGTYKAGIDTKTDSAIIVNEDFAICSLESGGANYLRTIIEKDTNVIYIGQQNTSTIQAIDLKPGLSGSVRLHHGTNQTNNIKLQTTGYGVSVTGLEVTGISTFQDLDVTGNNILIDHGGSMSGVTTIGSYYYDKLVINSAIESDNAALMANNQIDIGWPGSEFGNAYFTKKVRAAEFGEFNLISAGIGSTHVNLTVTVATKSTDHRYHGQGSTSGYVVDNIQSPFFTFTPGRKYRFNQSDGSNSTHQIKFYLEADRTTLYETGVTYNGTAGNAGAYTEIEITDSTPNVLHYQCVNHPYMGNAFQTNSNSASKKFDSDITLSDDVKAIFGSTGAGDLQIFHGSTGNYINRNVIRTTNTNELLVEVANGSSGISFNHRTGNGNNDFENMITATPNAGVDLYFNGNKRIETTNLGNNITGLTTITPEVKFTTNPSSSHLYHLCFVDETTNTEKVAADAAGVGIAKTLYHKYGGITYDDYGNQLNVSYMNAFKFRNIIAPATLNNQNRMHLTLSGDASLPSTNNQSVALFECNSSAYITLGSGTGTNSRAGVLFANSSGNARGAVSYKESTETISFHTLSLSNSNERLTISESGAVVSGVVTATSFKGPSGVTATFIGDGSGLTGVTASGSGIVIKDSGSVVGTAGTIDFGANLSVSAVSSGIVTITGAASGGGVTVQDEGSALSTTATTLNFVGDGVVASGTGATKTITIAGGGGSSAGGGLFSIEGERNGGVATNQYYAVGNGAQPTQGQRIPVATSLKYMTLSNDGNATMTVELYVNGSGSGKTISVSSSSSATADFTSSPLSIAAGDRVTFRCTSGSSGSTSVVAGWFHQDAVLPDSLVGTALSVSGISTLGNVLVGGGTTDLVVNGDARVTGILTVGTGSITIDPNEDKIEVGKVVLPTGNATTDTDAIAFAIALG